MDYRAFGQLIWILLSLRSIKFSPINGRMEKHLLILLEMLCGRHIAAQGCFIQWCISQGIILTVDNLIRSSKVIVNKCCMCK